ncbi:MAG TPA: 4-(cytidine 5'-diphospho)-2-C-methyl-D-erythritol kinase [Terriglobales bacterium]|nr:4-(cytidine 5'-diphospho)-2-C-methyl-D-erythritol kinase [Terriglobales bacterium]
MPVSVRSFAKINIGLEIGPRRADGFHALRTVYQTIALHDRLRVEVARGTGIEIRSKDRRVPLDESNTCWRMAESAMKALKARGRVVIQVEKSLPVQGGLGGASSNAVATLLALERVLGKQLPPGERLRLAAEVGSDLPLFLIGGTVLGVGRGEEVYPLEDLPALNCVIVTPAIGVSTPQAFTDLDTKREKTGKLTAGTSSDKLNESSRAVFAWLSGFSTGVPAKGSGDRAEALLLDLVHAGIENDFESVVFPQHPELRAVKRALEGAGAAYASLSGSGSTVYGLFKSRALAQKAASRLSAEGMPAVATRTLTRREYWKMLFG